MGGNKLLWIAPRTRTRRPLLGRATELRAIEPRLAHIVSLLSLEVCSVS
jgi:hypothetical protein